MSRIKKRYKSIGSILGIVIIVVTVLGFFWREVPLAQAAPESVLYFSPASSSIIGGRDVTLEARVDPGSNQVTAVEIHITFDSSMLHLSSITPGPAFSTVLQAAQINNTNGIASITVGVPLSNPSVPVTSDSVVASFVFSAISDGVGNVNFSSQSMAAAIGEGTDVIVTRTPATITVTGSATYSNANFALLVADWLKVMQGSPADVNVDGTVNSKDLGIMMSNWAD